mmetsp:Transcript_891/g.3288  ORF Transcript_891/g.3288 Transcript_891/m.3288 type:complete len:211 (+) Transcript_891:900-1532(+)
MYGLGRPRRRGVDENSQVLRRYRCVNRDDVYQALVLLGCTTKIDVKYYSTTTNTYDYDFFLFFLFAPPRVRIRRLLLRCSTVAPLPPPPPPLSTSSSSVPENSPVAASVAAVARLRSAFLRLSFASRTRSTFASSSVLTTPVPGSALRRAPSKRALALVMARKVFPRNATLGLSFAGDAVDGTDVDAGASSRAPPAHAASLGAPSAAMRA